MQKTDFNKFEMASHAGSHMLQQLVDSQLKLIVVDGDPCVLIDPDFPLQDPLILTLRDLEICLRELQYARDYLDHGGIKKQGDLFGGRAHAGVASVRMPADTRKLIQSIARSAVKSKQRGPRPSK